MARLEGDRRWVEAELSREGLERREGARGEQHAVRLGLHRPEGHRTGQAPEAQLQLQAAAAAVPTTTRATAA